jgi:hypothetical protein
MFMLISLVGVGVGVLEVQGRDHVMGVVGVVTNNAN